MFCCLLFVFVVFILLFWHLVSPVSVVRVEGLVSLFRLGIFMHNRLTKFKSNNVKVCISFWRQNKKAEQKGNKEQQAESETCPFFSPHVREKLEKEKQEEESDEVTGERSSERWKVLGKRKECRGGIRETGEEKKRQTGRVEVRLWVWADEPPDECLRDL